LESEHRHGQWRDLQNDAGWKSSRQVWKSWKTVEGIRHGPPNGLPERERTLRGGNLELESAETHAEALIIGNCRLEIFVARRISPLQHLPKYWGRVHKRHKTEHKRHKKEVT